MAEQAMTVASTPWSLAKSAEKCRERSDAALFSAPTLAQLLLSGEIVHFVNV